MMFIKEIGWCTTISATKHRSRCEGREAGCGANIERDLDFVFAQAWKQLADFGEPAQPAMFGDILRGLFGLVANSQLVASRSMHCTMSCQNWKRLDSRRDYPLSLPIVFA
jgi:hypothetical protein